MEELRKKLNKLIEIKGTQHKEVLRLSQELDKLILDHYKKSKTMDKSF
ncbi:MAG: aspartyl-phosphate phosphatase Spo0E family protein [Clostridiaceae bacterium]